MEKREQFSSRWALLLSTLGMAIGAGNIWRFPRLAGQYGGTFLILWVAFLLLWSIPLLMVEFSVGKKTRKGPIGAFGQFVGKNYTWMGAFVGICTMAIMFYYSVVTGWALKYFLASVSGTLQNPAIDHTVYWHSFTSSVYQPVLLHLVSLSVAAFIIYQGILKGIERANRILLPSLLFLLIIGVVRALTLPNALAGLNYFFGIKAASFLNFKVWLEALSQSAWSTGAGWGLVLTYSVYMSENEDVTLNAFITGFGNNTASLLAGNQGLSFIVIPQLFAKMPGGWIFSSVFFLALFFAALSSLIAMLELATRIFMDFGLRRHRALFAVAALSAVMGVPSAVSMKFFNNQDWVWGLGLIISGSFFLFAVLKYGVRKFRLDLLNVASSDLHIGPWFDLTMRFLIPLEAVALLGWWLYQTFSWYPQTWWKPFGETNMGTCLFQWGALIVLLLLFNGYLYHKLKLEEAK